MKNNLIRKKDILFSLFCGFFSGLFLILVIKNPLVEEFEKLNSIGLLIWLLPIIFSILFSLAIIIVKTIFRSFKFLFQFGKFAETGVLNTFIDMGILNALIWLTGITSGGLIALFNAFSFSCATINSYFWNKFWTFEDKEKVESRQFFQFFLITMIGMGINTLIVYLGTTYVNPLMGVSDGAWANLVKIGATLISMIWNFFGYKFFIFKK